MKRISITFFYLLLCSTLYSQVDSSAESFFPHHIGDVWEYDEINRRHRLAITKDTIIEGSTFLYFNNAFNPYYKIDTSLNVIRYQTAPYPPILFINLNAKVGEWWISEDTTSERPSDRIVGRLDNVSWGNVFGIFTQIKRIGYYRQPVTDTTYFDFWRNDSYFAAGIGYLLSQYDVGPPDEQLLGCIINGVQYGTVSSVYVKSDDQTPSKHKLYPAFPNPFNPSTIISYQLPKNNIVSIKVYDMLGREIAILVNDEQQKGYHQIRFTPQNLSSGVYLIRMTAGTFTQTTKIIYSK